MNPESYIDIRVLLPKIYKITKVRQVGLGEAKVRHLAKGIEGNRTLLKTKTPIYRGLKAYEEL